MSDPRAMFCAAIVALLALTPGGCGAPPPGGSASGAPAPFFRDTPVGGTAPSPRELANASYAGIYERPVALVNGIYEGEPFAMDGSSRPTLRLVPDPMAAADLDGEAGDEAVVLLLESSGGSGTFLYLGAAGRRDGTAKCLDTALVGDRPQVRSMALEGDRVRLDMVEAGDGDPACCPSRVTSRWYAMSEGELVEVDQADHGAISIDLLLGTQWRLTAFDPGGPAPAQPAITLRFGPAVISGSSGCNTYDGSLADGGGGVVTTGPLATTRMACPEEVMDLERRYLARIGSVVRFGFRFGRLVLEWRTGSENGSMLFEPAVP